MKLLTLLLVFISFTVESAVEVSDSDVKTLMDPTGLPEAAAPKGVPDTRDVFLSREFVEFSELDSAPSEFLRWDEDSGKYLVVPTGSLPYVVLRGQLKEDHELSLDNQWINLGEDGKFEIKLNIPKAPKVYRFRIFRPDRTFVTYRLIQYWLKLPPAIRLKVRDVAGTSEKQLGFTETAAKTGQAQLYAGATPTSVVDLDSEKHSNLTFRLYAPPDSDISYDSWTLVVRDKEEKTIGQLSRLGTPPPYIDWREVSENINSKGTYSYQLNLIHEPKVYEGVRNTFETVEGLSILNHPYLPFLTIEPKYEIGYFDFSNQRGVQFSNIYIGADVPIVLQNRYIIRGAANTSLHSIDPRNNFTYTRVGAGLRFFGQGENSVLGHPHIYRLDVVLSHSAYTIYPGANVTRFSQVSLLLEPQIALWAYNFIVPSLEYGTRTGLDSQKIALGLSYYFFIRPWSLRLGMGVQYEKLYDFHPPGVGLAESLRFTVLRTLASFVLFL